MIASDTFNNIFINGDVATINNITTKLSGSSATILTGKDTEIKLIDNTLSVINNNMVFVGGSFSFIYDTKNINAYNYGRHIFTELIGGVKYNGNYLTPEIVDDIVTEILTATGSGNGGALTEVPSLQEVTDKGASTTNRISAAVPVGDSDVVTYKFMRDLMDASDLGIVFDTTTQMNAWFGGTYTRPDGRTPADLKIGEDIFINAEDEHDYWWNGTIAKEKVSKTILTNYYNIQQVDSLLLDKVDKVTGKQLSTEDYTTTEKTKLAGLDNYDDSTIVDSLANKVDKVTGKQLSTEDYSTAEKTKLAGLDNYDDSTIVASLANKVDKVAGKGLSTEDYSTAEKTKLAGLDNYDDLLLKEQIQERIPCRIDQDYSSVVLGDRFEINTDLDQQLYRFDIDGNKVYLTPPFDNLLVFDNTGNILSADYDSINTVIGLRMVSHELDTQGMTEPALSFELKTIYQTSANSELISIGNHAINGNLKYDVHIKYCFYSTSYYYVLLIYKNNPTDKNYIVSNYNSLSSIGLTNYTGTGLHNRNGALRRFGNTIWTGYGNSYIAWKDVSSTTWTTRSIGIPNTYQIISGNQDYVGYGTANSRNLYVAGKTGAVTLQTLPVAMNVAYLSSYRNMRQVENWNANGWFIYPTTTNLWYAYNLVTQQAIDLTTTHNLILQSAMNFESTHVFNWNGYTVIADRGTLQASRTYFFDANMNLVNTIINPTAYKHIGLANSYFVETVDLNGNLWFCVDSHLTDKITFIKITSPTSYTYIDMSVNGMDAERYGNIYFPEKSKSDYIVRNFNNQFFKISQDLQTVDKENVLNTINYHAYSVCNNKFISGYDSGNQLLQINWAEEFYLRSNEETWINSLDKFYPKKNIDDKFSNIDKNLSKVVYHKEQEHLINAISDNNTNNETVKHRLGERPIEGEYVIAGIEPGVCLMLGHNYLVGYNKFTNTETLINNPSEGVRDYMETDTHVIWRSFEGNIYMLRKNNFDSISADKVIQIGTYLGDIKPFIKKLKKDGTFDYRILMADPNESNTDLTKYLLFAFNNGTLIDKSGEVFWDKTEYTPIVIFDKDDEWEIVGCSPSNYIQINYDNRNDILAGNITAYDYGFLWVFKNRITGVTYTEQWQNYGLYYYSNYTLKNKKFDKTTGIVTDGLQCHIRLYDFQVFGFSLACHQGEEFILLSWILGTNTDGTLYINGNSYSCSLPYRAGNTNDVGHNGQICDMKLINGDYFLVTTKGLFICPLSKNLNGLYGYDYNYINFQMYDCWNNSTGKWSHETSNLYDLSTIDIINGKGYVRINHITRDGNDESWSDGTLIFQPEYKSQENFWIINDWNSVDTRNGTNLAIRNGWVYTLNINNWWINQGGSWDPDNHYFGYWGIGQVSGDFGSLLSDVPDPKVNKSYARKLINGRLEWAEADFDLDAGTDFMLYLQRTSSSWYCDDNYKLVECTYNRNCEGICFIDKEDITNMLQIELDETTGDPTTEIDLSQFNGKAVFVIGSEITDGLGIDICFKLNKI